MLLLSIVAILVAVAALPEVSCVPAILTPSKLILWLPSNGTPPIVMAVSNLVAVSALPCIEPLIKP